MNILARLIVGIALSILVPATAMAADDPFLGTWRLSKAKSIIAKDPGIKSKEFVFTATSEGVMIDETLEMLAENGKKHRSQMPYAYGKSVAQPNPGLDALFVIKPDNRTAYWTGLKSGQVIAQLQVSLSTDGKQMTFRYLWSAADPTGAVVSDRYLYEKVD